MDIRGRLHPGLMPDAKESAQVSEFCERCVALHEPFSDKGGIAFAEMRFAGQACRIGKSITSFAIFDPSCKRAGRRTFIRRAGFPFMMIIDFAEAIWEPECRRSQCNAQAI